VTASPKRPHCTASNGARWLLLIALDARDGDQDALRLLPAVRRHHQALEVAA